MSFISDFLKKAYEEKKSSLKNIKTDKKLDTKVKKKQESLGKVKKKENIVAEPIENYKETSTNLTKSNKFEDKSFDEIKKQLSFYLGSNSSLDNELHKMNELEKDLANPDKAIKSVKELRKNKNSKNDKEIIKIEKENYSWKWIIIQFVLGIIFLGISYSYIQNHPAERKFLESSVQLWINTFQSIASKFGGKLGEEAEKNYIEKRKNMVLELIDLEKKLNECLLDNKIDTTEAQKVLSSIKMLKNILMDYNYLPLDKFISKYNQFDLQVYSYKENIDKFCK